MRIVMIGKTPDNQIEDQQHGKVKQGFKEHKNKKGFIVGNFKGGICQLLGFKSGEGYSEYKA